jgi:hypothetical protein
MSLLSGMGIIAITACTDKHHTQIMHIVGSFSIFFCILADNVAYFVISQYEDFVKNEVPLNFVLFILNWRKGNGKFFK